ncbi:hypothetical protein ACMAZE_06225 [Pseudopelagicola sp. nBUS_20]|uniref:hypothetical protein n=1 Tax=Pseudopelagicola sp. nBUS_20 TaxID=3395317 RepID=UPI003EBAF87F
MFINRALKVVFAAYFFWNHQAVAQQSPGWFGVVDGLGVYQSDSDLSAGGSFSANRTFLRGGALYRTTNGTSFGLLLSYGQFSYDFNVPGAAPWEDVRDVRISAPIRFSVGDRTGVVISPQLRWDYETDASASDGFSYGVFAGVGWKASQSLTIGPAFGVFSKIGGGKLEAFPALLVDWDISNRWNLSTGTGLGASQGPGVSLSYQASKSTTISLITRSERVRFRLDNAGVASGGVGEDASIPVVLSLGYEPNPGVSLVAFAGAEFDGRLKLENASGSVVSSQSYKTAPIAGLSFKFRF